MYLRGIRGATVIGANEKTAIIDGTSELLSKMMDVNNVNQDDVASIFFSATPDLDDEFPAVAARKLGLINTPLLCLNEIPVKGSLQYCVRVLIHVNTEKFQQDIEHVYLGDAQQLRPDIKGS
jgi:chorismate mutase